MNWFMRDWDERTSPTPVRRSARVAHAHLQAMLDLDVEEAPKIKLNGPLVDQAQATLARMSVAERTYKLVKSEAHNQAIEDWVASQHGGPDMDLVFEYERRRHRHRARTGFLYV